MDAFTPAVQLASALRRREIGPVELLDSCLATVARDNPELNAVVWLDEDAARGDARRWAEVLAGAGDTDELPPFAGVPLPIKDLVRVAGWPTTFGSRGAPEAPSERSALVVEAFARAGFVLTGRTNTPELGPITITENLRHGVTRNPWAPDRTPGGSSGGAAAAVAAGMFPVAHASDGGGSIRIPSSCCGLVGLKPSRGRVPEVPAHWLGLATEGAVCRTVADAAAVLDCISGPDPTVWWNLPAPPRPFSEEVGAAPGRLRIGYLDRAPLGVALGEEPRAAVARAASLLEEAGHHVEHLDLELVDIEMLANFLVVVNAGYGDYPEVDFTRVEPHNVQGHATAQATDSLTLVRALAELQRFSHEALGRWGRDFDVLMTPTMAIEPPPAGELLTQVHEHPEAPPEEVVAMAIFTAPFNVTGQPAINLPLHWSPAGLPVGVQLIGGPADEATLLRLAAQLETMSPWAARHPAR